MKDQKAHIFLYKKMSKGTSILISEEYNFMNKEANNYNFVELDYYKLDAFN